MNLLRRPVLLAVSLCALLLAPFSVTPARATVDDALSFALEAVDQYIKGGYTLREDTWGGDLPVNEGKAITHQLFKGNDYWFCLGTDVKGAKISVHIYDGDGNLVEETSWQKDAAKSEGAFAGARINPKRTGTYFLIVKVEKSAEERTSWGIGLRLQIGALATSEHTTVASDEQRTGTAAEGAGTLTLQFESARAAEVLYAGDFSLLKTLGETLGVRVTTREGWIKFDGEPAKIAQARRVFDQLERARQGGMTIQRHEFLYALRSVANVEATAPPPPVIVTGEAPPPTVPNAGVAATPAAPNRELAALGSLRIQTSARKPPVLPKTTGQLEYLKSIAANDVVFGVGPAGTGKTYLAMAAALASLKREQVGRIILTRPAVEAGETLGFLPGDLQEKIFPYLRPLYDALHALLDPEELARYMEKRTVEIAPLAYMRGRTLDNAFIILDEAQNTTMEQMFMFLTRMGQGSKVVVTGDRTQIDLPANKRSGLVEAIQALKGVRGINFVFFEETDIVRHELVQSIIRAYRRHRYGDGDGGGAPPEGSARADTGGERRPKN